MHTLTNSLGLILLIYLWLNSHLLEFKVNMNNILAPYLNALFKPCPTLLMHIIILIIAWCLLRSILYKKNVYLMHLFSLIIMEIILKINMDVLLLNESTTTFFFNIYHPIPLEYKISHLHQMLSTIWDSLEPKTRNYLLPEHETSLTFTYDKLKLKPMNAKEINIYAEKLFNDYCSNKGATINIFWATSGGLLVYVVLKLKEII